MSETEKNLRGLLTLHESFMYDEEYNSCECLSYSKIKDIYDHPENLIAERDTEEKEWYTFGTLVDLLLTSSDSLDEKVFVNDEIPTEQFKRLTEYLISNNLSVKSLTDIQVEEAYNKSGSSVNWSTDTKRKKLLENCSNYYSVLTDHKDKIIVSTDLFNEASKMASMLLEHPWSSRYFLSPVEQLNQNIEILYQFKIQYTLDNLKYKSKIDIIRIDHNKKTIELVDLKTGTDSPRYFAENSIFKYKYVYQACLYRNGFEKFLNKLPEFNYYEMKDFVFLYVNRNSPTFPVLVTIDTELDYKILYEGIRFPSYVLPSIKDLNAAASFHIQEVQEGRTPSVPYDFITNNGIIKAKISDYFLPF